MKKKMDNNFENVIRKLKEYLEHYCKRKGNLHISEDTLRYFFFAAVLDCFGVNSPCAENKCSSCSNICKDVLIDLEQEIPFNDQRLGINPTVTTNEKNCKLDTYLLIENKRYAVEFKKHYKIVDDKDTGDHPEFIGQLINDFNRLYKMKSEDLEKYQITLVDSKLISNYEMKSSNTGNNYKNKILDKEDVTSNINYVIEINENELKEACKELRKEKNGVEAHSSFEKGLTKTFNLGENKYEVRINNKINIGNQYVLFVYKLSNN